MTDNLSKLVLLSCLTLLLTACSGWHLRGSGGDSSALLSSESVYLSGEASETYQLVKEQLIRKNALTDKINADFRLVINKEQWKRRRASFANDDTTLEYELTLTLAYQIFNAAQENIPVSSPIKISRSYTFDQSDIAGKDKEEQLIRYDIRRVTARQILQQLQFLQR